LIPCGHIYYNKEYSIRIIVFFLLYTHFEFLNLGEKLEMEDAIY